MSDPVKARLRDTDSAETAFRLKAFLWSGAGGALGMFVGVLISRRVAGPALFYVVVCAVLMWALVYFGTLFLAGRAGSIGSSIYFSSGSTMPVQREYSLAESYAARGQYAEALAEYERNVTLHPDDVALLVRVARLHRDGLRQPEAAARWFRRALTTNGITPPLEALTTRELVELYVLHLRQPRRAIPELARLAERHSDPSVAHWARQELASLRQSAFNDEQSDDGR